MSMDIHEEEAPQVRLAGLLPYRRCQRRQHSPARGGPDDPSPATSSPNLLSLANMTFKTHFKSYRSRSKCRDRSPFRRPCWAPPYRRPSHSRLRECESVGEAPLERWSIFRRRSISSPGPSWANSSTSLLLHAAGALGAESRLVAELLADAHALRDLIFRVLRRFPAWQPGDSSTPAQTHDRPGLRMCGCRGSPCR